MKKYMIDFRNFFNGDKRTITLGDSRTEANKNLKIIKKRFNFWWRRSEIYC